MYISFFIFLILLQQEEIDTNESGTFVTQLGAKQTSLSDIMQNAKPIAEPWEQNILSLEKGEWAEHMDPKAFKRYTKNRASLPDVFKKNQEQAMQELMKEFPQ